MCPERNIKGSDFIFQLFICVSFIKMCVTAVCFFEELVGGGVSEGEVTSSLASLTH